VETKLQKKFYMTLEVEGPKIGSSWEYNRFRSPGSNAGRTFW